MSALVLPPGKTEDEAVRIARSHLLACKRAYPNDEERALAHFEDITRRMCNGDRESGKRLAQLAIWTPSP
jgi:hypothetical protein